MSAALKVALITAAGVVLAAAIPPVLHYYLPPSLPKDIPQEPPKPVVEQASKLPTLPSPPPTSERLFHEFIGQNLICWGRTPDLPMGRSGKHTRAFAFTFPQPFETPPTVTYGINVKGSGYSFAVYNAEVTETGYTGFLVEVNSRATDVPVAMNYTAIGLPSSPR